MSGVARHRDADPAGRRGLAAVGIVLVLVIVNLIVLAMTLGVSRDHDLTLRRVETVEAFFAAEAGMNMSIRETVQGADEDGDGTIGTISDDGDSGTDPAVGGARVVVTADADTPVAGQTTLTSEGRAGEARRSIESITE